MISKAIIDDPSGITPSLRIQVSQITHIYVT